MPSNQRISFRGRLNGDYRQPHTRRVCRGMRAAKRHHERKKKETKRIIEQYSTQIVKKGKKRLPMEIVMLDIMQEY